MQKKRSNSKEEKLRRWRDRSILLRLESSKRFKYSVTCFLLHCPRLVQQPRPEMYHLLRAERMLVKAGHMFIWHGQRSQWEPAQFLKCLIIAGCQHCSQLEAIMLFSQRSATLWELTDDLLMLTKSDQTLQLHRFPKFQVITTIELQVLPISQDTHKTILWWV